MRGLVVFGGESTERFCLYHYGRKTAGKLQERSDESIFVAGKNSKSSVKHTVKAIQVDPRWILIVLAAENKANAIVV